MSASIEEVLSGLGAVRLTHDWSPDVDTEAEPGTRVLQIYKGEELIWAGPLLSKTPGKDGIELAARSHEYWLGLDEDGPVVEDKEFVAGTNKLSNGGFELGPLYWRIGENSKWVVDTADSDTGSYSARIASAPEISDPLQSDESFEAEEGQEYRLSVRAKNPDGFDKLLRYYLVREGKFEQYNLFPPITADGWEDFSAGIGGTAGDASVSGSTAVIGPTTKPQLITNPTLIGTVNDPPDAPWTSWGSDAEAVWISHAPHGVGTGFLTGGIHGPSDPPLDYELSQGSWTVDPGAHWRARALISSSGGISNGGGSFPGEIFVRVNTWTFGDDTTMVAHDSPSQSGKRIPDQDTLGPFEQALEVDVEIPEGHDTAQVLVLVRGVTDGTFDIGEVTFTRVEGNFAALDALDSIPVFMNHRYSGFIRVTSGAALVEGELTLEGVFSSVSFRSNIRQVLGSIQATHGEEQLLNFSIDVPSGYDFVTFRIKGKDVYGDSFSVAGGWLTDDDDTRSVVEGYVGESLSFDTFTISGVCPEGTERIHAEVVAEDTDAGSAVDNVSLTRIGVPISTSADVIDYLCRNPETGNYLVTPGSIEDVALPYDLRYRNMTCRTILKQFSRAVMLTREWRISTANVLDWGTPEALYEDRTDFVLKPSDVYLLDAPVVEQSAENAVQRVKVIGSGSETVGRRKSVIESTATNDPAGKVDYYGNPWTRTRIVSDATVDHITYATSLAEYEAGRNAENRQSVRLRLADWTALAKFNLGDWIYAYVPEAGLVDFDNEMNIDGEVIWPARKRVISRTWRLGNDFSAELLASDDSTFPLENVIWETDTTAEVELGDARPEFVGDPMAGASINQFLRFRASSPR